MAAVLRVGAQQVTYNEVVPVQKTAQGVIGGGAMEAPAVHATADVDETADLGPGHHGVASGPDTGERAAR